MITLQQQPDDRIQQFLIYKKEIVSKIMDLVPSDAQYKLLKEELEISNDQIYILLGITDPDDDDKGFPESTPVFPDPETGAL